MTKKQSPTSSNWLKNNPTLTEVENYFGRIKDGDVIRCLFFGSFLDPENNQMYRFPAALIVSVVDAMKNLIAIYLPDCNAQWWVQPIEPYTFEVFTDNQRFSLKIYDISQEEWPPHIREWHEWFANNSPVSEGRPEELTRLELIDPALAERGWTTEMIVEEFTFTSKVDESHNRVDYALSVMDEDGKKHQKVAFIEAKHRGRTADFGLGQARAYGDLAQAQIRFVFATNGIDFIEFDRLTETTGIPRPIQNFPTPAELRENWLAASRQIDKPLKKLPIRRSGLDKNSTMDARAVAELLLPVEAVRLPCLTLMAETSRYANEFGSGKWEVTLPKSGRFIRVNVGKLEVAAIFHNFVHVILDDELLTEEDQSAIGRYALLYGPPIYSSVPSSVACNFRSDQISIVKPLIWKSHQALIRKAAGTVGWRTGWYNLHSLGVIAYLREATNQTIPDPDYSEGVDSSHK